MAFDADDDGHWRAALECGHFQHVRHDPPLTTRSWVQTEEGRALRIVQVDRDQAFKNKNMMRAETL